MTSQSAAALRARYVDQAASDLEENRRLQRELQERITMLKQEEALLGDIISLAERYEGLADASRLPEQVQDEQQVVTKPKGAAAGATSRRTAATRNTSAGAPAKSGTRGKPRQALLGDLLMKLLDKYDEPRPAKELRDELLKKHPDRNPTPQVVRNTLEALVAKGRVRRHKQQRSVMYTLAQRDGANSSA
ncbi:hypothetical protein ACIRF8_34350 [Streptomyces sp. NPDC102406]|uniref:hypothetical protein n=1 Tax=Streptomyces sp. NPDC102406 TaxID=3366171 RepID=UPI00381AF527